jgi:hypothetical protein
VLVKLLPDSGVRINEIQELRMGASTSLSIEGTRGNLEVPYLSERGFRCPRRKHMDVMILSPCFALNFSSCCICVLGEGNCELLTRLYALEVQ